MIALLWFYKRGGVGRGEREQMKRKTEGRRRGGSLGRRQTWPAERWRRKRNEWKEKVNMMERVETRESSCVQVKRQDGGRRHSEEGQSCSNCWHSVRDSDQQIIFPKTDYLRLFVVLKLCEKWRGCQNICRGECFEERRLLCPHFSQSKINARWCLGD